MPGSLTRKFDAVILMPVNRRALCGVCVCGSMVASLQSLCFHLRAKTKQQLRSRNLVQLLLSTAHHTKQKGSSYLCQSDSCVYLCVILSEAALMNFE